MRCCLKRRIVRPGGNQDKNYTGQQLYRANRDIHHLVTIVNTVKVQHRTENKDVKTDR